LATRQIEELPVSMLKDEEYYRKGHTVAFKSFDKSLTISHKDFDTNIFFKNFKY
jgi:hypothetical protein